MGQARELRFSVTVCMNFEHDSRRHGRSDGVLRWSGPPDFLDVIEVVARENVWD